MTPRNMIFNDNMKVFFVTEHEFMNEIFEGSDVLAHGTRYTVCVHADEALIQHETWIEFIEAVSKCSDGIIVDLTPPITGRVWIGINPDDLSITYQV